MIEVNCPYCKENIEIITDEVIYNLNRLRESLYKCDCCQKTFRIYYDGNDVKVLRIGRWL